MVRHAAFNFLDVRGLLRLRKPNRPWRPFQEFPEPFGFVAGSRYPLDLLREELRVFFPENVP